MRYKNDRKRTISHHLHDQMTAHRALLGGLLEPAVQIILFAVDLAMYIVERLASQRTATAAAYETVGMVEVACKKRVRFRRDSMLSFTLKLSMSQC